MIHLQKKLYKYHLLSNRPTECESYLHILKIGVGPLKQVERAQLFENNRCAKVCCF